MTLAFRANSVRCADAIDGEILQVCFETMPESGDEDKRDTPYVLISQNFEFPGPATIEWHAGSGYDGGAEMVSVTLTRNRALVKLDRDCEIEVSFSIDDRQFAQMNSYLRRMLADGVFIAK